MACAAVALAGLPPADAVSRPPDTWQGWEAASGTAPRRPWRAARPARMLCSPRQYDDTGRPNVRRCAGRTDGRIVYTVYVIAAVLGVGGSW